MAAHVVEDTRALVVVKVAAEVQRVLPDKRG
jgi:hypothetical protein